MVMLNIYFSTGLSMAIVEYTGTISLQELHSYRNKVLLDSFFTFAAHHINLNGSFILHFPHWEFWTFTEKKWVYVVMVDWQFDVNWTKHHFLQIKQTTKNHRWNVEDKRQDIMHQAETPNVHSHNTMKCFCVRPRCITVHSPNC